MTGATGLRYRQSTIGDSRAALELHGVPIERLEPTTMGALVERCPEVAGVWRIADLAAATALGTHEARARVRAEDTGIDATRLDAVEEAATQFAGHRRTSR